MADLSSFKPDGPSGSEYNFKDATARAGIESSKTLKSSVVTVTDAAPINAEDITVDITPVQDLHGYDRPWAGGAGKNLLPMTVAGIKAANTSGSWSGNVYTLHGVTAEILTDSDNNVTGIKVNGTASNEFNFFLIESNCYLYNGMILNGCPSGGSISTYNIRFELRQSPWMIYAADNGTGSSIATIPSDDSKVRCFIRVNKAISVSNLTFYPMIRLSTETDATFAPYSNICPIEGRTGAELDRVGKNWLIVDAVSKNIEGVSYTVYEDGSILVDGTSSANKFAWIHITSVATFNSLGLVKGESYILSGNPDGENGLLYIEDYNNQHLYEDTGSGVSFTYNGETNIRVGFIVLLGHTINNKVIKPMIRLASITDSTYEPYQGKQYTASFGETVHGGKWHVTAGGTDKTHGNIASYNGETINEPWLSSLDEYSPGATPTTGAQVVYPLTTPTTISTPKQNVPMLQGINTVSADCGDTQLKYQPDNVIGELKGEIRAVEAELAEVEENLEIVYEDHVANTSMGIIVDGYSVGDVPFSNALDIVKPGYIPIAVTDTSVVLSSVADQGEIATHCLLDVTNNRVRFYVHVMDSAASLTIPPNSLTFRVAYKKA